MLAVMRESVAIDDLRFSGIEGEKSSIEHKPLFFLKLSSTPSFFFFVMLGACGALFVACWRWCGMLFIHFVTVHRGFKDET